VLQRESPYCGAIQFSPLDSHDFIGQCSLQSSMSTRRVPAALHRELSEYASLLRALRTRDTLDVTKHLTKPSPFNLNQASDDLHPSSEDEMDEMLDKLSKSNHFSSTLSSHTDDAQSSRSRSRSRDIGVSCRKKHVPRNHWTRWPLMFDDVLEPEWTLEDEVAVISSQVLRAHVAPLSLQAASVNDSEEPEEDLVVLDMQLEDDDPDYAYYIPSLTFIISNYLSAILGQLASLTSPRPASMQNRIEPLNWQAVIDAVVSLGDPEFSNPKCVSTSNLRFWLECTTHQGVAKRYKTIGSYLWSLTRRRVVYKSSRFVSFLC